MHRAAVIALLAESFILMNLRQPFFWFIIILTGISYRGYSPLPSENSERHFKYSMIKWEHLRN